LECEYKITKGMSFKNNGREKDIKEIIQMEIELNKWQQKENSSALKIDND